MGVKNEKRQQQLGMTKKGLEMMGLSFVNSILHILIIKYIFIQNNERKECWVVVTFFYINWISAPLLSELNICSCEIFVEVRNKIKMNKIRYGELMKKFRC